MRSRSVGGCPSGSTRPLAGEAWRTAQATGFVHTYCMANRPILSPRDVLASIHAALPPQRQGQRELPKLARHLCNLTAAADLPDRLDAWLALNRWLAGGALWNDVYIDAADVHGSATQRFAVLMDVLADRKSVV